jgi:hypothetical protein
MLDFLQMVWDEQPEVDASVFTASKTGTGSWKTWDWNEFHMTYPRVPERIRLDTNGDVYFCPHFFEGTHRYRGRALPSIWMHSDLDEADPTEIDLKPTVAWETSPGRYQGLWLLRKPLPLKNWERLNRALNHAVSDDPTGWSITKVLRVPGSINYKRKSLFTVRLMWEDGPVYRASEVREFLGNLDGDEPVSVGDESPPEKIPNARAVYAEFKGQIPRKTRKLLRAEVPDGDRSAVLWKLENELLQAGVPEVETLALVKTSVWNKFKGRRSERSQLWRDIRKASAQVEVKVTGTQNGFVSYDEFIQTPIPPPSWMVAGIWSDKSHGIMAGEPKTYKSTIATDLSVSIASGTKFLSEFEVDAQGPVTIIQEENTPGLMRDKLLKIAHSRGLTESVRMQGEVLELTPHRSLPISLMNQQGFDLTDEDWLERLDKHCKKTRPQLVVLDPLYRIIGDKDENSSKDMAPILNDLMRIKTEHNTGILIIHHYHKIQAANPRRAGQRMAGTKTFHGWVESALYVERVDDTEPVVTVTTEHRNAPPQGQLTIAWEMGAPGDYEYRPSVEFSEKVSSRVHELVDKRPGIKIIELAERLGVAPKTCAKQIEEAGLWIVKGKSSNRGGRAPMLVFSEDEARRRGLRKAPAASR